jgi:hypothetical protein
VCGIRSRNEFLPISKANHAIFVIESLEPTVRSIAATMLLLLLEGRGSIGTPLWSLRAPRQNIGSIFVGQDIEMWGKKRFNLFQAIHRVYNDEQYSFAGATRRARFPYIVACVRRARPPGSRKSMIASNARSKVIGGRRIYDAEGQTRLPRAWLIAAAEMSMPVTAKPCRASQARPIHQIT